MNTRLQQGEVVVVVKGEDDGRHRVNPTFLHKDDSMRFARLGTHQHPLEGGDGAVQAELQARHTATKTFSRFACMGMESLAFALRLDLLLHDSQQIRVLLRLLQRPVVEADDPAAGLLLWVAVQVLAVQEGEEALLVARLAGNQQFGLVWLQHETHSK
jgi:hypothetical protein